MMKKIILSMVVLSLSARAFAQTGGIGINTPNPNSNAALDIVSTNKGLLPPRVALTSTNSPSPLSAHVAGMIVYNTATAGTSPNNVSPGPYYNDGTQWSSIVNVSTLNTLGIPRPAIYQLNSTMGNFLSTQGIGQKQILAPVLEIANSSGSGITYAGASQITFTPGLYAITFTYEADHNNGSCSLSSYFVDFPVGSSGTQRVHSTASHVSGGSSNHGGSITFTARITSNYVWNIELGRGQSGNCTGTGMTLYPLSTQVSILRISN
ncbi:MULTISPECIES: hypothetical protein [unclassified Chryseobacterium]|uniref:hypothetical protein n=1 Tax=unclassified Chryseobacterium TaxID=2593645 RepID=UPI0013B47668|nr:MULTISPECIES: hypothetical protein [unclassified Chryseobacterium]MDQ1854972.1 hypothetical protein [Chryseobacterium sp. WLY505]